MKTRLLTLWETLWASFWFVPTLMVAGAAVLAIASIALDERVKDEVIASLGWVYTGGPEGARGLSPGINDPFTAISCIDRLGAALARLSERRFPSPYRYDDEGNLRVIVEPVRFRGIVDTAFNQIRQYGQSSAAVTIRLLEAIAIIAGRTSDGERRAALLRQADMIWRGSQASLPEPEDRADVEARRYRQVAGICGQPYPTVIFDEEQI